MAKPTPPARRLVLIAATFADAKTFAAQYAVDRPIVITPRSPYGARGFNADGWMMTPAVSAHPALAALIREVQPTMDTRRRNA